MSLSFSFAGSAVEPAAGGVAGVAGVAPAPEDAVEPDAALLGGVAGVAGVAPEDVLEEVESFFSTDAEPEGAGVVVEPAEEDEPDGGVVFETARSLSLSQPVSNPAPSARDTATAKVESLIM